MDTTAVVAGAAILVSAIQALIGFIIIGLRTNTSANSEKIHQLEKDLGQVKVEVAAEYVRKREIQPTIDKLEHRFDKRLDELELQVKTSHDEIIERFRHLESRIYQLGTHNWDRELE